MTEAVRKVLETVDSTGIEVDWLKLTEIALEGLGIPLPISPTTDTATDIDVVLVKRQSTRNTTQQTEAYLF